MPRCPDCGREVDGLDREVTFGVPDEVYALSPETRRARVVQTGKSFLLFDGERCFLRVLLPVTLDIGHEFRFGVWIEVSQADFKRAWSVWDDPAYLDLRVDGRLANAVPPWRDAVLGADCSARPRNQSDALFIDESSQPILEGILSTPWSTHECEQLIEAVWSR
ncbi:MAG: DUF2199 domain-containing protein [Candidatus Dormibacteria bacterium]